MDQLNPLPTRAEDVPSVLSPRITKDGQHPQRKSPLPHATLVLQQVPARVFKAAHTALAPQQCAPSAWGETRTVSSSAQPNDSGTAPSPRSPPAATSIYSCEAQTNHYASTGNVLAVAPAPPTTSDTSARAAWLPPTELKIALEHRRLHPITPYKFDVWETKLRAFNLLVKYPSLPQGLQHGFFLNIPRIHALQTPPNSPSSSIFLSAFETILNRELHTGRYIGPFSQQELLSLLGPFQTSPISIIPKPGKPGKFRVIQNFSFPHAISTEYTNPSINSSINSDDFPCTWGTFDTVCTIIRSLPPGSQAATRDIAEAYRTVPLHHSQWAAAVVRSPGGGFCADTCISFGMGPSAGVYGHVADAGTDILHAEGLGPLVKWVDDHLFFRVRREYSDSYNAARARAHTALAVNGQLQTGGRLWFKGTVHEDGTFDVYAEDCAFPLRDLSLTSPRSLHDSQFNFDFADINHASVPLGFPWELTKDTVFAIVVLYLGLMWNLAKLTVQLSAAKKAKYLAAIAEWRSHVTHVLLDVQRLYGKLLHSCLVVPTGRAYLTAMETMLRVCGNSPFMPHHAVRHLEEDLNWWEQRLSQPFVGRSIPQPPTLIDLHAFSDASSSVGIAIVIDGHWRAWTLHPGWRTLHGQRDIGWAEAVGVELLLLTILDNYVDVNASSHFRLFCDNQGIVLGWKTGRSRNRETNLVFRRIHQHLEQLDDLVGVHLEYVPSAENPADGPSRGVFPPRRFLLPPVVLPGDLPSLLVDADLSIPPPDNAVSSHSAIDGEQVDGTEGWNWGEELIRY